MYCELTSPLILVLPPLKPFLTIIGGKPSSFFENASTPNGLRESSRSCMGRFFSESSPVSTVRPGAKVAIVVRKRRVVPLF